MLESNLALALLSAAAITLSIVLLRPRSKYPLPPGPPKRFLIGNLLDFPMEFDWLTYAKWAETYGRMMSLSSFSTTIIVVSDYAKAIAMLDKKSPIYSSRPYIPFADLIGFKNSMPLQVYGQRFRGYRKAFHHELGSANAMKKYWPQEEEHVRKFLRDALADPIRLEDHCLQHAGSIILRVAYGYIAKDRNDPFIEAGNAGMASFSAGCKPGTYAVNQIPILKYVPEWFPGATFQKIARMERPLYTAMITLPFDWVKEQMAAGTAEESFTSRRLQKNLTPEDEDILIHASGSMFGGGSETTAVMIHIFFLLMIRHPDVCVKAQEELDRVVGRDRLPNFEDRTSLPYCEALVKEILRYHPVVPSGFPHCTTEDDVQDGYFIPKGSLILCNIWKMSRDPELYSNPYQFNPTRFLGPEPEMDPKEIIYGFGRRLCPGRLLADTSVYIAVVMSLSALNISPVMNPVDGKPLIPEVEVEDGVVSRIRPFKCAVSPRYPGVLAHLN